MASVNTLTRTGPTIRVIDEATDSPSVSSIVGSQVTRSLWADAVATTLTIGGGAAHTTTNLRISGSTKLALSATQVSITNADLTCAGAGASSERFGAGATAAGAGASALGNGAGAGAGNSIAVGLSATINATSTARSVVIGQGSSFGALGGGVIVGGTAATTTGAGATVVGLGASAAGGATNATAVGFGAGAGASNATVVGSGASVPVGASTGNSVVIGKDLTFGAGGGGVLIGSNPAASPTVTSVVSIGSGSACQSNSGVALGGNANVLAACASAIAIGATATGGAPRGISIGSAATTSFDDSVAIGADAQTTAANQVVFGGTTSAFTDFSLGKGVTNALASALVTVRATDGVAAGIGSSLTVRAGNGDGLGTDGTLTLASGNGGTGGGGINLQTSGATQWSLDDASGDLLTSVLNNIGDLANTARPANVYVGTSVVVGATVTITTSAITGPAGSTFTVTAPGASATLSLTAPGTGGSIAVQADTTATFLGVAGTAGLSIGGTGRVSLDSPLAAVDALLFAASNVAGGMDVNLGTGGLTIDTTAGFSIDGATASNVTVSGATSDLTFGARGATITLNQVGDTTLTGFTATSIVGALNELANSGVTTLFATYTNGNGATITEGQAVYISAANTVDLATATADAAAARVIGFVDPIAGIAAAASGDIGTAGVETVKLVGSLTLSVGDELFLSTTAGSCTNVAPATTGNVIQTIGYLKDTLTYDGGADLLVQAQLVNGPKAIA